MATAKKAGAKQTARKRVPTKTSSSSAGKSAATSAGKKRPAKPAGKKSAARKYSPEASAQVARELHEMHEGKLTIGKSDKKVTNPKQAIAIGLAEARRAGKKVPPNPNGSE